MKPKDYKLKYEDSKRYKIKYANENRFNSFIRALKLYNMKAYKEFIFIYLPNMRQGIFEAERNESGVYKQQLTADRIFEFVFGKVYVSYIVEDNIITLLTVEPEKFLDCGRKVLLPTYKGCPITCARDKFLVDFFFVKNK